METPRDYRSDYPRPQIEWIRKRIHNCLGDRLPCLYLYGSLVTGDFDPGCSDIDLLAVTQSDLTEEEFRALGAVHRGFCGRFPEWDARLEVAYVAKSALAAFRENRIRLAVISPGESFNRKDAGRDWLINWWVVRNQGLPLIGPPPESIIGHISDEEFASAVRGQVAEWQSYVETLRTRSGHAYAILTMCRALHAVETGVQASKPQAAAWVQRRYPDWRSLIEDASRWRRAWREQPAESAESLVAARRFVRFALTCIEGNSGD